MKNQYDIMKYVLVYSIPFGYCLFVVCMILGV